ncbi:hypothetical protein HGP28_06645 [Vibrio sp. SM6]|uniref:Proline and glycine rich transmembrane protein gene in bax n=1 Tax=Vibrio agarilyticus TaxID=2726741 RepID=A0A7X8YGI2_9VIBR|nr:hypothetical protein [Vibrio agarilyticus]NLS12580.1 hypothetical protein [Vibrio agarilyticus]
MSNNFEKDLNLGGSIEQALSGQYKLSPVAVFKEAWQATIKHFLSFSPAIMLLVIVQLGIFYIALKLQLGNPAVILEALLNPELLSSHIVNAIFIANFSYEVISAPVFAGVSLMAMSHVAGLRTKTRHIGKGLNYTVSVILAVFISTMLQGIAQLIFPLLQFYLMIAFTHSILLICEKRVSPIQSLWLSIRAINKKFFAVAGLYLAVLLMFIVAAMFYGIGLIFVLPFFFHMKGILYREMFGIKLKIVATEQPKDSQVFDA